MTLTQPISDTEANWPRSRFSPLAKPEPLATTNENVSFTLDPEEKSNPSIVANPSQCPGKAETPLPPQPPPPQSARSEMESTPLEPLNEIVKLLSAVTGSATNVPSPETRMGPANATEAKRGRQSGKSSRLFITNSSFDAE